MRQPVDERVKLAKVARLGKVMSKSRAASLDEVVPALKCCTGDDRYLAQRWLASNLPGDFVPIHIGHRDVEDNNVRMEVAGGLKGLSAVVDGLYAITPFCEPQPNNRRSITLIVDDQNSRWIGCRSRHSCTRICEKARSRTLLTSKGWAAVELRSARQASGDAELVQAEVLARESKAGFWADAKPVPPDERRDHVFSVKLTLDEKQLLDETDARTWARDVLVKSARKRR